MLRVVGLVMLCAGYLPESHAARHLRRPTQSVAPQVLLSTDASSAKKTQASNSAMLKAQTGVAQFFYPHFLLRLVSTKKGKDAQPASDDGAEVAPEGAAGGGSGGTRMLLQLLFGLAYYFIIVKKYPELGATEASQSAKDLLQKNAVMALAEDAQALDLTSKVQTGFFSVYPNEEGKKEGEEAPAAEAPAEEAPAEAAKA